ncbi:hypothetical protein CU097_007657 [Rhizopus azygosporus]|uniref:Uncharacterized protein n=1 Tax=Rhizopus azygosporus TaxID=86630 RepID=A0A367JGD7_RHIAZ|nr:hypothetical protein CU097_007657 [Rhizopus azygosporus]
MYIQKTRSQRKGVLQLGVYLHRQSIPSQEEPQGPYSFSRYSDKRKVVKTWFKIYCPSRGPKHALTLFQSSPDNFSVLQSWGWRSTTLCAEEDSSNISEIDLNDTSKTFVPPPPQSPTTQQNGIFETKAAKSINTAHIQKTSNHGQNGSTLRFTVVMGHV